MGSPESSIERIEKRACQQVTIDDAVTAESLAKCDAQALSPLFAILPREIRELVWAYATAPYEVEEQRYAMNEYYYRPDHSARLATDTNLLLTCRRVWLEANALPMLQAEHCFWYHRPAPDGRSKEWMARLSRQNRQNFGRLRLFPQMYAIEHLSDLTGDVRRLFLPPTVVSQGDFQPKVLHVTVRHTDWWYWEDEAPLRLKLSWVEALLNSDDVRSTHVLKLDLETLDYKVAQLEPIVQLVRELESKEKLTHIVDGKPMSTFFRLVDESTSYDWSGPADLNGQSFSPYQAKDTLNYHVVTLTWKLHFPQLPRAHVPKLRLAPRYKSSDRPSVETVATHTPYIGGRFRGLVRVYRGNLAQLTLAYQRAPRRRAQLIRAYESSFRQSSFETQFQSQAHAEATKARRRSTFERVLGRFRAVDIVADWEAKRSLLRFSEDADL